jgi:singapore isolate B (sub-type 7) whole genome shotgun sequence assembly, scaffold_17
MSMGERYQVRLYCFEELVKEGASLPEVETSLLTPEDMCMICYTSGTTGVPKGALLTHGNMIAVSTAVVQYIDTIGGLTNEDIHMSYLPMAHVFEHFVQSAIVYYGARIGFYQGDTTKLVDDILHLRPTIFPSVPRLLNRITDSIFAKVRKQSGIVQMLFSKGFETKVGDG